MTKPVAGEPAPDFTLPADDGTAVTLSAMQPSPVVLFFYPKDDTPGCTIEALEFSAILSKFKALDAQVFGISKDTLAKHEKFRCKHDLAVPLLSDSDNNVCQQYGVWGEKKMFGKTYMGILRSTVLIDGQGRIAKIWSKVKPAGHAADVLAATETLGKAS